MRVFITLLVLIFSFHSLTKADDIFEFEIEGMSIGDSALDYFSEVEIKNNLKNYYTSKKYIPVQNDNMPFFETYDAVDFAYKNNDNNYTIVSLVGVLFYDDNIKDCYKKMDDITEFLDEIFVNQKKIPKTTYKHASPLNVDGKSIITDVEYIFKSGDVIVVACYDYSIAQGSQDHLSVAIDTASFDKWLKNEANK
jgi:hypothetical protein